MAEVPTAKPKPPFMPSRFVLGVLAAGHRPDEEREPVGEDRLAFAIDL